MNRQPAVITYPASVSQLYRGINKLAELLAVTLGPNQGVIVASNELKPRPEVLTDAAVIARRLTDLPDPEQNMGAMLGRNLAWRMRERCGDGSATTLVLAQAIAARGLRYLAAGANPVQLVNGIRQAAHAAVERLRQIAIPVQGEHHLVSVARSVTGHEELAWLLGEMYDILGPLAYITVEDYVAPYLEREYIDGGRWLGNLASPYLVTIPGLGRGVGKNVQVALYDGVIGEAADVRPLLEIVAETASRTSKEPGENESKEIWLLLVAHRIHGEALTLLTATHQRTPLKVIAFGLKRAGQKARTDLDDLALLTGAQVISPEAGRQLAAVKPGDLGWTRRADAGAEDLFLSGGKGDPQAVRQEIEHLEARRQALDLGDDDGAELEMRLGRLSGSAGILKVGAISDAERDYLHQRAEQGARALRLTMQEGLLPGGGSAYLHCLTAVERVHQALEGDQKFGAQAVAYALEAPFRRILLNAGMQDAGLHLAEIRCREPGWVFDVRSGRLEGAERAGIFDAAFVQRSALETAASGAMMLLSTGTLVVKRKPKVSLSP